MSISLEHEKYRASISFHAKCAEICYGGHNFIAQNIHVQYLDGVNYVLHIFSEEKIQGMSGEQMARR